MLKICSVLALSLASAVPAISTAATPDHEAASLRSVGASEMDGLMNALFEGFAGSNPGIRKGIPWSHRSDSLAIGALMFEQADLAPMVREFDRNELAPYDHQFRGDMMKAPAMIPVATRGTKPVWVAVNRRPGAPLSQSVHEFLDYVLSEKGQGIVQKTPGFERLAPSIIELERLKLAGYYAPLDPRLPKYNNSLKLSGEIRSVGSDGMKSLMEHWIDAFANHHPEVRRGERWEHLGTLNGFHALVHGLTDLAPMGRELWPQESAAYQAATGKPALLEIRVARGGFNTQQRTTAQAIFVHPENPVREVTLSQLADIFGARPTITKWGQLGASGAWADMPIAVYMPPASSPNAMSVQMSVLKGSSWNPLARSGTITETADAVANVRGAIAFGGFEEGGPGLKSLAVARDNSSPPITATYETASNGSYPLTRYMFIRLADPGSQTLPQHIVQFLRFILSSEGQSAIPTSGYFPLTAAEVQQELEKLQKL